MSRTSVITDWRTRDEDLPAVPPGEEYECAIAPQTFVVLRRVLVRDLVLVRLRIGAADEIPFEQVIVDGRVRTYRPEIDDAAKARLAKTGAVFIDHDAIRIVPGMDVRVTLRNDRDVPTKPRAALVVEQSP